MTDFRLETSDGQAYRVTPAQATDLIHRVEQHLLIGVFDRALLVAIDEDGTRRLLVTFVPGLRRCHRIPPDRDTRLLRLRLIVEGLACRVLRWLPFL